MICYGCQAAHWSSPSALSTWSKVTGITTGIRSWRVGLKEYPSTWHIVEDKYQQCKSLTMPPTKHWGVLSTLPTTTQQHGKHSRQKMNLLLHYSKQTTSTVSKGGHSIHRCIFHRSPILFPSHPWQNLNVANSMYGFCEQYYPDVGTIGIWLVQSDMLHFMSVEQGSDNYTWNRAPLLYNKYTSFWILRTLRLANCC